jgi:hypothetical protein
LKELVLRVLIAWSLIVTCLLFIQRGMIENRKDLIVIYKADNKGAEIKGKVSNKKRIGELYTLTIDGNTYIVSEEKYNKAQIGDEVEI